MGQKSYLASIMTLAHLDSFVIVSKRFCFPAQKALSGTILLLHRDANIGYNTSKSISKTVKLYKFLAEPRCVLCERGHTVFRECGMGTMLLLGVLCYNRGI